MLDQPLAALTVSPEHVSNHVGHLARDILAECLLRTLDVYLRARKGPPSKRSDAGVREVVNPVADPALDFEPDNFSSDSFDKQRVDERHRKGACKEYEAQDAQRKNCGPHAMAFRRLPWR